jgi:hypothetical protein
VPGSNIGIRKHIPHHTFTLTESLTMRTGRCYPRATQFPLLAAGARGDVVITSLAPVAGRKIIPASRHRRDKPCCRMQRVLVVESNGQRASGYFWRHMLLRSFPARLTLVSVDQPAPLRDNTGGTICVVGGHGITQMRIPKRMGWVLGEFVFEQRYLHSQPFSTDATLHTKP